MCRCKGEREHLQCCNGSLWRKAPDEAELLEKTKQAGELESLKAVEDNLSFTPEEEQYLDTLSGMFKDGVPSDDGLDEMQKR